MMFCTALVDEFEVKSAGIMESVLQNAGRCPRPGLAINLVWRAILVFRSTQLVSDKKNKLTSILNEQRRSQHKSEDAHT